VSFCKQGKRNVILLLFLAIILSKYVLIFFLIFGHCAPIAIEPPQPRYVVISDVEVTAYCPCAICNEKWAGVTCQGLPFKYFLDNKIKICAVDPIAIPLNSKIQYNGDTYWAKDVGGKIKGRHIDILMPTHEMARKFGRKFHQIIYLEIHK
jgi:3D (Asp-Asp-Asp) domain-containing protein